MNLFNLKNELQSVMNTYACTITPEMKLLRVLASNHARKQSQKEGKSYSIFDLDEGGITVYASAYEKRLSEPIVDLERMDNRDKIHKLTHPNDLPGTIENELRGFYALQQLHLEEKENFKLIYLRRLKNKSEGYQLYLHKVSVLECDINGMPWLLEIVTEQISDCIKDLNRISEFYLLFPLPIPNRKKREVFVNNTWLTEQELNILQLVSEGKNQLIIADILHVSVNTVKTHYNTIRKKLNIKTIQMAANFAKLTGILMHLLLIWTKWGEEINDFISGS